jgi:hypothetical protein
LLRRSSAPKTAKRSLKFKFRIKILRPLILSERAHSIEPRLRCFGAARAGRPNALYTTNPQTGRSVFTSPSWPQNQAAAAPLESDLRS